MKMRLGLIILIGLTFGNLGRAESRYAQNCERVIGVGVPKVDCQSPNGSLVSVGQIQNGQCDNPGHGLTNCNPGTRFIKYVDTITRGGVTETITTMVMCRKTNDDIKRQRAAGARQDDNIYSDIGVIQYNETKHATCWFSKTSNNNRQKPTARVGNRMVYPSPSDAGETFWGNVQPEARCINCHQSSVWLRTPFAMRGVQPGKGFKRRGGNGDYEDGDGNAVPRDESIGQKGLSCSVGKPDWNRPDGRSVPFQVRIDESAYDRLRPNTRPTPDQVSSGYCTSCHYIGMRMPTVPDLDTNFCNTFLPELKSGEMRNRRREAPFANHFWMPRGLSISTKEQYLARYGRALEAAEYCCKVKATAIYRQICTTQKFAEDEVDEAERRTLTRLNQNGACALCPECNPREPRKNGAGARAPKETAH